MTATLSRWLAPVVLAAGLGLAGLSPAPAQAAGNDDLARVIVDVADVIYHSGQPYYRHGRGYGHDDRLVVVHRHGRPVYYRNVYRSSRPYGNAYGHYGHGPSRYTRCNKHGKCKVEYYDARYDRHDDRRYYGYDRHDRYDHRDDRRGRNHDDD